MPVISRYHFYQKPKNTLKVNSKRRRWLFTQVISGRFCWCADGRPLPNSTLGFIILFFFIAISIIFRMKMNVPFFHMLHGALRRNVIGRLTLTHNFHNLFGSLANASF